MILVAMWSWVQSESSPSCLLWHPPGNLPGNLPLPAARTSVHYHQPCLPDWTEAPTLSWSFRKSLYSRTRWSQTDESGSSRTPWSRSGYPQRMLQSIVTNWRFLSLCARDLMSDGHHPPSPPWSWSGHKIPQQLKDLQNISSLAWLLVSFAVYLGRHATLLRRSHAWRLK